MIVLDIATTVCVGLLVGTEFAVSAFVNPVLWQLDERGQSQAIGMFARKLGRAMPFWYGICFLLLVGEAVARHHQHGVWLLGVAIAIWAAVIVLTLMFLVPVNNRLAQLNGEALPAESRRSHRQWDARHRIRVAALLLAMVCLLVALL